MYGYSYRTVGINWAEIIGTTLVIAFIAAIVLAVAGYRKYVSDGDEQLFNLRDSSTWRPFLRFDKLVIDKILKGLYLFTAIFTALFFLVLALASLAEGIVVFLVSLVTNAIGCLIAELLVRVAYESIMLSVIMTRNTTDILNLLSNRPAPQLPPTGPAPVPPAQPLAPAEPDAKAPAPEQPQPTAAPAPEPPAEGAPAPKPHADGAPAPEAPAEGGPAASAASICPECGAAIQPGSHFCPECGWKLD